MEKRVLQSEQVRLRPLEDRDIAAVGELARDKRIADNTFVPHPYSLEDAEDFVKKAQEKWREGEACVFAVTDPESDDLRGVMGLHPEPQHKSANVGYWIGAPYWGRGLATAALRLLIRFGFEVLELNRIEAGHFDHNPASGRVMRKAGMQFEGTRRGAVLHRDSYKDVLWHAILREDYLSAKKKTAED